jgi:hypothetical protein
VQNAFDNVCHEHLEYYSLASIERLLRDNGMEILSAELNDVNAGSFRLVVTDVSNDLREVSVLHRDLGRLTQAALLAYERANQCDSADALLAFKTRVDAQKEQALELLRDLNAQGKRVYGYGASTKGNTLLQFYGLDASLVTAIAERQSRKFGKFTVGSAIPIVSEDEMRAARPDYLLVLPWHFVHEFLTRETAFLQRGGKFIVPLPELRVIG